MLRKVSFISILAFVTVVFLGSAYAQESKGEKKTDETKINGTIIQVEPDPSGKLAPLAIKTDNDLYPMVRSALTTKMAKYVGSKAKVTGRIVQVGDKKAMEPWLYERQDQSGKKSKFKQPVEG
jgi:hypothetical protein